jgi:hypothetical protein
MGALEHTSPRRGNWQGREKLKSVENGVESTPENAEGLKRKGIAGSLLKEYRPPVRRDRMPKRKDREGLAKEGKQI